MHWVPRIKQHELPWKRGEMIYCKLKITQLWSLYRVLVMWVKVCYIGYFEAVVSGFQYIYTNCRIYRGLSGIEVYKEILMFLFFPLYICINLSQFYNSSICSKVSTYSLSTTKMMINIPLKYVRIYFLSCLEF